MFQGELSVYLTLLTTLKSIHSFRFTRPPSHWKTRGKIYFEHRCLLI